MWWFVGISGLQCATSEPVTVLHLSQCFTYQCAATGNLPECMEVWPEDTLYIGHRVTTVVLQHATVASTDSAE